ncbi:hypothetical protein JTE90_017599, partial [Oedothorax gibbosus]
MFPDLNIYMTDTSGNQLYTRDENNDEVYYYKEDLTKIFAIRDGEPYYAKTADYSEYYPTVKGVQILLTVNGKQKYAKLANGKEIYPRQGNRDEVIMEGGKPLYAKNELDQFYYPRRFPGAEFIIGDHFLYETDGSVKYPKFGFVPYYPIDKNKNERFYGKNLNGKYAFVLYPQGMGYRYAGKLDYETRNYIEYYPPDNSCIYFHGTDQPMYALDFNSNPIFPKNNQDDEYYLKYKDRQDDCIYINRERTVLSRYATDHNGNDIYPVKLITSTGTLTEIILNESYAKNAQNEYVYPLDEYNNEYTLNDDTLSDS